MKNGWKIHMVLQNNIDLMTSMGIGSIILFIGLKIWIQRSLIRSESWCV